MARARQIWLGLYIIPCGVVNAYAIDAGADGLVLVDAGLPGASQKIFDGIRNIGRRLSDVRNIILTHAHADHIGGLSEVLAVTRAQTWMHELDAPIAEAGTGFRRMTPTNRLTGLFLDHVIKPPMAVAPAPITHRVKDGDVIPLAGGLQVVHVPGHCSGQIALLWLGHRALIAGDVCGNILGRLGEPIGYEDAAVGHRSQERVSGLDYDLACFGHGSPLSGHASVRMARRWVKAPEAEVAPAAH